MSTSREDAGQRLRSGSLIERTLAGWKVPSETGNGFYLVELNDSDGVTPNNWWDRQPSCTCPDNRLRHIRCKHIYAIFHLLRDLTNELGESDGGPLGEYQVQGYPQDSQPEALAWTALLSRVFQGEYRLDEVYEEFEQGQDLAVATIEELWSELTFYRFLDGLFKVLGHTSAARPAMDPRVWDLFQRRHEAVAYELQKRAAPVVEERFNDFFAVQEEAELAWALWNTAMYGLRPIPPLIPPKRPTAPIRAFEGGAPLQIGVDEAFGGDHESTS